MGERNLKVFSLLKEQKKRKTDMAKALGISPSAVTQWEKKGTDPNLEQSIILAEFFSVPLEEIYFTDKTKQKFDKVVDNLSNTIASSVNIQIEDEPIDVATEIQRLINHLTGDNSSYCNGKIMSKEGELALLNSLKQDVEFLNALYKNDNK